MNLYSYYLELQDDLKAFAISLSNDYHMAKDLVQDAYIKAMEYDEKFETMDIHQCKAWFFRTMKNRCIDNYRKNQRLDIRSQLEEVCENDFQNKHVLWLTVEELPALEKELVIMHYILGLSSREIAEETGMNASTIRNHLAKAIGHLREYYKEDVDEEHY